MLQEPERPLTPTTVLQILVNYLINILVCIETRHLRKNIPNLQLCTTEVDKNKKCSCLKGTIAVEALVLTVKWEKREM